MAEGSSEEKKSIGVALIQNTPLAIFVIGLFLAVLGAAGGWAKYGLAITEPGWRIAICLMGLVCAGMGLGLHQKRAKSSSTHEDRNQGTGTAPRNGIAHWHRFTRSKAPYG